MSITRKIRVGAVNYLNTRPLIFGFEQGMMKDDLDLTFDYPSRIAAMLINDEIDLGLVPVVVIPKLEEHHIITDYCIGADGPVASVCLFSEVTLDKVEKLLLDYQSRTSVVLTRLLCKEYWKVNPKIVEAGKDFRDHIGSTTAGLVIGDRALEQRKISSYVYDLGEAWKNQTGLPFVFAAWISNKTLPEDFIRNFNLANGFGVHRLQQVLKNIDYPFFDLYEYYTTYISYTLDTAKRKGMQLFLQKMADLEG
ncbi:MAG: menaquinone biosynthesis protein [Chitinophagaceae bacterium]